MADNTNVEGEESSEKFINKLSKQKNHFCSKNEEQEKKRLKTKF